MIPHLLHKISCCFDDASIPTLHETIEVHYQVVYFEELDVNTSCIEDRFNQRGFKTYENVQEVELEIMMLLHFIIQIPQTLFIIKNVYLLLLMDPSLLTSLIMEPYTELPYLDTH